MLLHHKWEWSPVPFIDIWAVLNLLDIVLQCNLEDIDHPGPNTMNFYIFSLERKTGEALILKKISRLVWEHHGSVKLYVSVIPRFLNPPNFCQDGRHNISCYLRWYWRRWCCQPDKNWIKRDHLLWWGWVCYLVLNKHCFHHRIHFQESVRKY